MIDRLRKLGIYVCSCCSLRWSAKEDARHFFDCHDAQAIWDFMESLFQVRMHFLDYVADFIFACINLSMSYLFSFSFYSDGGYFGYLVCS